MQPGLPMAIVSLSLWFINTYVQHCLNIIIISVELCLGYGNSTARVALSWPNLLRLHSLGADATKVKRGSSHQGKYNRKIVAKQLNNAEGQKVAYFMVLSGRE